MEHALKKQIEEILSGMQCQKDFACYRSAFKKLCHAKDIGIEKFVECLEKIPQDCKFAFPFASTHLCKCPVRVFIAKELNK